MQLIDEYRMLITAIVLQKQLALRQARPSEIWQSA